MKKQAKINKGILLENAIDSSGISITEVCRRAGYKRGSYYRHIANPDLKLDILDKYGIAINHDFSEEIPEMVEYYQLRRESRLNSFEKIEHERDFWRDEYAKVLKDKNDLLRRIEILESKLPKK